MGDRNRLRLEVSGESVAEAGGGCGQLWLPRGWPRCSKGLAERKAGRKDSKPGQKKQGWREQPENDNDLGGGADRMWRLRRESRPCSGFWLGQWGRVWGWRDCGEGAAQREEATCQCWVGDGIRFAHVDFRSPLQIFEKTTLRYLCLLANGFGSLDGVSLWVSLCV